MLIILKKLNKLNEFSRTTILMAGLLLLSHALSSCSNSEVSADLIINAGEVLTMEGDAPEYSEAVAVKDGKVIAVGNFADLKRKYASKGTAIIDYKDAVLLPGFVDSHSHISIMSMLSGAAVLSPRPAGVVNNMEELIAQLKAHAQLHPEGVLLGYGYDELLMEEQRHPTIEALDAAFPDRPVVLLHNTLHMGVANSLAFKAIGGGAQDPPGGKFVRNRQGKLTGAFEEQAVMSFVPIFPMPKGEEALDALQKVLAHYAANGITTAQEGHALKSDYQTLKAAADLGLLPIDVVAYIKWSHFNELNQQADLGLGKYINGLKVGGVKIVQDGSPQIKTAFMSSPFHICPPHGSCSGYAITPYEEFSAQIKLLHENNVQTIVHCNGDSAIGMMIRAVREAELNKGKRDLRFTIVHAQTIRQDQLDAIKDLGLYVTFFPSHTYYWGDWHEESVLGEERAARISPLKSALDRGIVFGIHSDAPIVPVSPLDAVQRAVMRTTRSGKVLGPDERIDVYTALKSATIWGAYMYHEEQKKGSIRPGKQADLVVLSKNPLKAAPEKIGQIEVLATYKDGKLIYER